MTKNTKNNVKTAAKKAGTTITKGAKKVGKTVASNPTTALYVAGGALAIFLGYKAIKTINSFFNGDGGVSNSINFGYNINVSKLSIGKEQARNYAAQLLKAFNHRVVNPIFPGTTLPGTDEKIIKQIFNSINAEDFKLIYNEFGQKDYAKVLGGSPTANWFGGQISEKQDLIWWLREELSSFWDRTLYNRVKEVINQAGSAF